MNEKVVKINNDTGSVNGLKNKWQFKLFYEKNI